MAALSDRDLRALIADNPDAGWRAFIDQYTPTLVALIERLDLRDRDEAMDLYALICERLAADDCARLRRHDPAKGPLAAWLAVVVRHAAVDWIRSRAGRRRLFGVIQELAPFDQQVFQLYYWQDRSPSGIAEELAVTTKRQVSLIDVLSALDRVHERLSERHYRELVAIAARSRPAVSLDSESEDRPIDPADASPSVEARLATRQRDVALSTALTSLPAEDAAIVRLHYLEGLSLAETERALHVSPLTRARLTAIIERLKAALAAPAGAALPHPEGRLA